MVQADENLEAASLSMVNTAIERVAVETSHLLALGERFDALSGRLFGPSPATGHTIPDPSLETGSMGRLFSELDRLSCATSLLLYLCGELEKL